MNGHLCRCGTYPAIIRAIKRAAADDGGRSEGMSAIEEKTVDIFGATLSRKTFVKGGGALVVALSVPVAVGAAGAGAAADRYLGRPGPALGRGSRSTPTTRS